MTDSLNPARKKELIREYKKTPKQMGAYSIRNTENDRSYVGVSRDLQARMNRHRFMLNSNAETDIVQLQADWNAHGADAFEFSILEVLEPPEDPGRYDPGEDLLALLELWCEELRPYTPEGYNPPLSTPNADTPAEN
ncbi:MAG: GIY-YIG nuclease family protein [Pseudomonadales bacterium]